MDALGRNVEEGRVWLRNATVRCQKPLSRGYPNGVTYSVHQNIK